LEVLQENRAQEHSSFVPLEVLQENRAQEHSSFVKSDFYIIKIANGLLIEENAISFWKGFQAMYHPKWNYKSYQIHMILCFGNINEVNKYFIAGMKCVIDRDKGLQLKNIYNSLESSKKFINIL